MCCINVVHSDHAVRSLPPFELCECVIAALYAFRAHYHQVQQQQQQQQQSNISRNYSTAVMLIVGVMMICFSIVILQTFEEHDVVGVVDQVQCDVFMLLQQ